MKKIAILSMMTGFALILSYVEALLPLTIGIPGIRLGLANFAILLALYLLGSREAFMINLARILLAAFLFGNFYTLFYSLSGALVSFFCMCLCKKSAKLSPVGVSVVGGVSHNMGQLAVAAAVVETWRVVYYLPWLLVAGCMTGFFIGLTAGMVMRKLPKE